MQAQRARRVKDLAVKLEIIELVFTREVPDQKLAGEIVMEHLESVVHALVDRGAAMLPRESEDIEAVMHLDKLVLQRRHLLNHRQRVAGEKVVVQVLALFAAPTARVARSVNDVLLGKELVAIIRGNLRL